MNRPAKPYPEFPMFPHPNGQWCKKINKLPYYFGAWKEDWKGQRAINEYRTRIDDIRNGLDKPNLAEAVRNPLTLGSLQNEFLKDFHAKVTAGEASPRTLADYQTEVAAFVQEMGSATKAASLGPANFAAYHQTLIVTRKLGRHARKRTIAYIKHLFRWGAGHTPAYPLPIFGNGFVAPDTSPEAMSVAKQRAGEVDHSERIVTGREIDAMLSHSSRNMKAVILLGINCGLGPADIGRLRWSDIDFDRGCFRKPRGKTGIKRKGYLWKRTRRALQDLKTPESPEKPELIFRTKFGSPFYQEVIGADGKVTCHKVISNYIGDLRRRLKKIGFALDGVTHYKLRHTFATLAKRGRDQEALNYMMGHADHTMGQTYTKGYEVEFSRVKRLARIVYRSLWPKAKELPVKKAA